MWIRGYLFLLVGAYVQIATALPLVNIKTVVPDIMVDLKYATADNFLHQVLYPFTTGYLHPIAANALKAANHLLRAKKPDWVLKIWDAYRPVQVQKMMWQQLPDTRYVANPANGGSHQRGFTVDVTLYDTKKKCNVPMPTGFDEFSPRAAASATHNIPPQALANRALLQEVMTAAGFEILRTEWWHFNYKGWREQPVLDLDVARL